jgi:hypothetical protein
LWWLIFPGICERGGDPVNTGGLWVLRQFLDGVFVVNVWWDAGENAVVGDHFFSVEKYANFF